MIAGVILIGVAVVDTVGTLVATRIQTRRWWPTAVLYRYTWPWWRAVGRKIEDEDQREGFLSIYGPLSLLTLLVFWVTTQVVGWGLVWWGLRDGIQTLDSLLESIYYAGVGFFTVGFGDVIPTASAPRVLVLVEAFFGLTTMALLIGFLPTLFAAYSTREELVSTLDDLSGTRVTPLGLIEAYARDGDATPLYEMFTHWEMWTARVLESHSSYPMLMLFRSKQSGQSWIAASVIVTETAALCVSMIDGPPDPRALTALPPDRADRGAPRGRDRARGRHLRASRHHISRGATARHLRSARRARVRAPALRGGAHSPRRVAQRLRAPPRCARLPSAHRARVPPPALGRLALLRLSSRWFSLVRGGGL